MAEQSKGNIDKPLDKLTIKELREIAMEIPHTTAIHDMKKEELIAFISEARGIKTEGPRQPTKAVKIKLSKQEIKAKIRELKVLKEKALEERNRKESRVLRHRISKLKKLSRLA